MRCRGFCLYEVVVVLAVLSVALRYVITVDVFLLQQADHLLQQAIEAVALAR